MVFSSFLSAQLCRLLVWFALAAVLRAQSAEPTAAGCTTGPSMLESNHIFVNGRQYVSDEGEVECNGTVTSWTFCHYVIGYRLLEMEIWAGVWRRIGAEFNLVGLNVIVLDPPGFGGDQFRCVERQVEAADWFEAQEGDYVGFYLPDNGVFVASATPQSDPNRQQMQLSMYGYAEKFNASDLITAANDFGRALVRAYIGEEEILCRNVYMRSRSFSR